MIKERLSPGARLDQGRFEVVRAIKAGGMGAVYEVVDHNLGGKTYALKEMINPGIGTEEQQLARERFISEVQVMMTLRHPNIPRVTASFMHGNSFYFVMDLIRGTDLSQRLKEKGDPGLPPEQVVSWALQALEALEYLHKRQPPVVHRDIKPSNLLVSEDTGRVVLIDFGISCVSNPGEGLWIGTPGYAPPEQQAGRPEPRSDLYALGATMHHLITGVKPKDFDLVSYESVGIKLDSELSRAIAAATATWPEDRVSSVAQMRESLRKLKNVQVDLPESACQNFEGAVDSYKESVLYPALKALISRYGNECHTRFLPPNLDYLQFVLASPTPFELQVVKDEDRGRLLFRYKSGILDAKSLGEVDPGSADREETTHRILDRYLELFEETKSSGGMFM